MPDGDRRRRTFSLPVDIQPSPTPEEAAAIVASLKRLSERDPEDTISLRRSRWRLAGLLGRGVEPGMKLEGSLWSYSRWEGIA
jgi:hypothetical protein